MKKRPMKLAVFVCHLPELGWCTMTVDGNLRWRGGVVGMASKAEAMKNAAETRKNVRKMGNISVSRLSA